MNKGTNNDALFRVNDQVNKYLNDRKLLGIIFQDLAKTFDMVNHKLFLRKVESYG